MASNIGSNERLARPVAPMLATLGSVADIDDSDDSWSFEMKWDGIRAIATVTDGRVTIATRNGNDVTATYPDLQVLAAQLLTEGVSGDTVLDGEIVALGRAGRPDFGRLQGRMGLTRPRDVTSAVTAIPVDYMIFDILEASGRVVATEPYSHRRATLHDTVREGGRIHVPPAFDGDLDAAVESSRELGLEGVVAKKRDSTYAFGRRSRAWIKIKHHKTQEVVIGGWRPGNGRRAETVGSLLMGVPDAQGLHYVGRVGTGFNDRDLDAIFSRLSRLRRETTPFVDVPAVDARDAHWVTPSLVGEVEFAEWTTTERLRQPTWRGWRTDKAATDVVREG
jgi:bifunctional non-homologous end joining protein LigD